MTSDGCQGAGAAGGMAMELFQVASLLVGDEGEALRMIESSLATMEIDPCVDPERAREQARSRVVRAALSHLAAEQPAAFRAESSAADAVEPCISCIQGDDLQVAGVSPAQLGGWLERQEKPELRRGLREWLEELPMPQRAIFVQRAVLGQGNDTAAHLLREAGGSDASGWTAERVSGIFRRALCSLANSLAHAPAAEPVSA